MTAFDAFSFGLQLAHWDRQLETLSNVDEFAEMNIDAA